MVTFALVPRELPLPVPCPWAKSPAEHALRAEADRILFHAPEDAELIRVEHDGQAYWMVLV